VSRLNEEAIFKLAGVPYGVAQLQSLEEEVRRACDVYNAQDGLMVAAMIGNRFRRPLRS
jgi:hypothetical protein